MPYRQEYWKRWMFISNLMSCLMNVVVKWETINVDKSIFKHSAALLTTFRGIFEFAQSSLKEGMQTMSTEASNTLWIIIWWCGSRKLRNERPRPKAKTDRVCIVEYENEMRLWLSTPGSQEYIHPIPQFIMMPHIFLYTSSKSFSPSTVSFYHHTPTIAQSFSVMHVCSYAPYQLPSHTLNGSGVEKWMFSPQLLHNPLCQAHLSPSILHITVNLIEEHSPKRKW